MTHKEQVLRYVNRLRKQYNIGKPLDELPKGKINRAMECPIARALHASVGDQSFGLPEEVTGYDGWTEIQAPKYVQSFILAFDSGRYPELVQQ